MASPARKGEYDWRRHWKVPRRDLLIFTKQLATLLGAGVGIIESLKSLEEQPNDNFRAVIEELGTLVSSGAYLSAAMFRFPKVFSKVYIAMIRVGESTGGLVTTLDRLGEWLEDEDVLLRKVTAALTYPVIVFVSSLVMTLILFYFVMPGFVEIFQELGSDLPVITLVLIFVTEALTNPIALIAGLGTMVMFIVQVRKLLGTSYGKYMIYRSVLHIPLLGYTLQMLAVTRFCSSLSTTVGAGVSLPLSLKLSCLASGSPVLQAECPNLVTAISEGDTIGGYMAGRKDLYPVTLVQMMEVAEESSRIESLLAQASVFYSEEVSRRLEGLAAALEPIMLLFASAGVGTVLIGVFLPLYGFLSELGL